MCWQWGECSWAASPSFEVAIHCQTGLKSKCRLRSGLPVCFGVGVDVVVARPSAGQAVGQVASQQPQHSKRSPITCQNRDFQRRGIIQIPRGRKVQLGAPPTSLLYLDSINSPIAGHFIVDERRHLILRLGTLPPPTKSHLSSPSSHQVTRANMASSNEPFYIRY